MQTIAIINRNTDAIETFYLDTAPNQSKFGGPWGWPSHTAHVAVPSHLHQDVVKAVRVSSLPPVDASVVDVVEYSLEVDPVKLEEKTERKWDSVRSMRNAKLTDSDWTQMPDVPLSAEYKLAWQAYRQALRDFPSSLTDADVRDQELSSMQWPTPPV